MTGQHEQVLALLDGAVVALDEASTASAGLVDRDEGLWPLRIKFMRRMVERATAEMRHDALRNVEPKPV